MAPSSYVELGFWVLAVGGWRRFEICAANSRMVGHPKIRLIGTLVSNSCCKRDMTCAASSESPLSSKKSSSTPTGATPSSSSQTEAITLSAADLGAWNWVVRFGRSCVANCGLGVVVGAYSELLESATGSSEPLILVKFPPPDCVSTAFRTACVFVKDKITLPI